MTRLDSFRNRFSLQTLIIVSALLVAPAFGIAIAAALRGQVIFLIAIGGLVGIFVTLYAPIEALLLASVLGALLADTRLVDGGIVYYARFVPMGMLTVRTILDVVFRTGQGQNFSRTLLLSGLVFVAFAMFSAVYSLTPALSFQRALSMLFVIVSFGLGLPQYLSSYEKTSRALKMVIGLIAIFILFGVVFGSGTEVSLYGEESLVRLRGFFGNSNTQGLVAMLIFYPMLWWWNLEQRKGRKIFLAGLVFLLALLVLLSGSRASLVGLLAGGALLGLLYGRTATRYLPILLGGLVIVGGLLLVAPEYRRTFDFTNPDTGPVAVGQLRTVDRPYLLQRAIEIGMNSPIWGIGFGASDQVFVDDREYLVTQGVYISGAHNSYARMFVDLGVLGVLMGVAIFGLVLRRVWIAPVRVRRDVTVALMTATTVTGMTNAFFEDWIFGFGNASTFPLWFFFALILIRIAQLQNERAEISEPLGAPTLAEATP